MRTNRIIGAFIVLASVVAASWDSSSDTTAGASSATGDTAPEASIASTGGSTDLIAESIANVERMLEAPTTVGVTEPVSKAPEPGIDVVWLQCATPTCQTFGDGIEEAATLIGWNVERVNYNSTPEAIQAAYDVAIDKQPDVIMSSSVPPQLTVTQRQEMQDAGIYFVDCCTVYEEDPETATGGVGDDPSPPVVLLEDAGKVGYSGVVLADWAIAQTNGNVNSLTVNIPDFPIVIPPVVHYERRLATVCPETCRNTRVDGTLDDIGTNFPQMVVSEMQRDPSINYIVFTSGSFSGGVEAALVEAGFTDVRIIGNDAQTFNFEAMQRGDMEEAWLGLAQLVLGWRYVDAAIRAINGDPIPNAGATGPDDASAAGWLPSQILTEETWPRTDPYTAPENYQEIFKELWLLN